MYKFFATIFAALLFAACAEKSADKTAAFADYFDMKIADTAFTAQIAVSEAEKARGLMYRQSLGENRAMVFVYFAPQKMSFWMKNTSIPLDLAFFDANGVLLEVKPLYPHNLDSVQSASDNVLYCIEANSGFFAKHGIKSGDVLDLGLLKNAIKKRGY